MALVDAMTPAERDLLAQYIAVLAFEFIPRPGEVVRLTPILWRNHG